MADIYPESRVEEILVATIDGTEYTEYPQSRIEQLLIELKAVIEAGGGGGGTANYNLLINKPEIDGVELSGNKSLSDLGITQEIKKVMDMLAGQFDPTETYEEGKIVIYNKTLYMFTTDHAAGEFNPLEVEQTDMDRILAAVYNVIPTDLSDLTEDSTHRTVTDTEKSEWNSKQSNVNLTLTPDAVVSDRDVTDGSGNTLSVVADSVSTPKTVTGNPVIVEDALESNADGLVAKIVPIQSGSGDPSPENVRPISGRTSVNLGRTGKNLFDGTLLDGYYDNANFDRSGSETIYKSIKIYVTAGTYVVSFDKSVLITRRITDGVMTTPGTTTNAYVFTSANDGYIGLSFRDATSSTTPWDSNTKIQLEQGNTATAYEPYTPATLTIALGTTVYGGTLDVKTGVLTVTHGYYTVSDLSWTKFDSLDGTLFRGYISDIKAGNADTGVMTTAISSAYPSVANVHRTDHTLSQAPSQVAVDIIDNDFDDAAVFKSTMGDVEICYELATPTTIQLTGAELALLMGYNRITSDSGDITLTYKANAVQDLQTDKADKNNLSKNVENGDKSSKPYNANQFIIWKGMFCKAKTSIASGATFTMNTNIEETTVGEVLTALLNA